MGMRTCISLVSSVVALVSSARAQTALFDRLGDVAQDRFGAEVAFVGDVDADGEQDFAIGSPSTGVSSTQPGFVRVVSGRSLQVLATWVGGAPKDRFGHAIAGASDLDGDGNDDVLIGAPGAFASNPGGYAVVRSGATGLAIHSFAGAVDQAFGHAVAGGGFVDGDSVPDILIGAPYEDGAGSSRGRVYVYSGASGTLIRSHDGALDWGTFGWSVAFLGDIDGDGRDEYVAGAPAAWNNFVLPQVRAYDGATGAGLWTNTNANFSDALGWSLAPIGDLTGDGVRDLIVGAMQDAGVGCGGCTGKGYVRAISGATGVQIYQINNATGFYVGQGWDVAAVGDVNGNGYEDFACSRPGTEGCGGSVNLGVQIREGQTGALMLTVASVGAGSAFGFALASGDANADGLRDVICGAPCASPSGAHSGSIHAYTIVRAPQVYCESEVNSNGCTPSIGSTGVASATLAGAFDVRATSVLNNKSGLLFYSFKPRQTPFQGGHMCVVSPTVRTPVSSSGGTAPPASDCSGVLALDFNARIQSGVDPQLVAGEQVFAQYWSRDPADGSTTNLTDALAFFIEP
jgi:hypothetical protein